MTVINDNVPRRQYTSGALQTIFVYDFEIEQDSDLLVYDNDVLQILGTHYSVTNAGDPNGGDVVFVVGRDSGDIITIVRDIPETRLTDFTVGGSLTAVALNDEFDRLYLLMQQQSMVSNNLSIRYDNIAEITEPRDIILPVLEDDEIWHMKADGTGIEGIPFDPDESAAVLKGDLESNSVGKGASMVGKEGSGTVQDFIDAFGPAEDVLDLIDVPSSVNKFQLTNSATGDPILFEAIGSDVDVDIHYNGKGTALHKFNGELFVNNGTGAVTCGVVYCSSVQSGSFLLIAGTVISSSSITSDLSINSSAPTSVVVNGVDFDTANNVSGIATLTATDLGGTLSTASQPNVTSLGTLTSLDVDGINIDGFTISSSGSIFLSPAGGGGDNVVMYGVTVNASDEIHNVTRLRLDNLDLNGNTIDTVSGNLILNATSNISIANNWNITKTAGTEGQTLTMNASGGTSFRDRVPNDNVLVGGDFRINPWQRQSTFTAATTIPNDNNTYTADQWILLSNGNDIVDVTRDTDGSLLATVSTANSKFGFFQPITNANSLGIIDEIVSIQCEAKSSGISNIRMAVISWTGAKNAITSDIVSSWNSAGTDPTLVTNWTYESTPVDLGLTGTYQIFSESNISIDSVSANNVGVFFWIDDVDASVSDTLTVKRVKLEKSEFATPFQSENLENTLNRCNIHYWKSYNQGVDPGTITAVGAIPTVAHDNQPWVTNLVKSLSVPMFDDPITTFYSTTISTPSRVRNITDSTNRIVTGINNVGQKSSGYPSLSANAGDKDRYLAHITLEAVL